MDEVRSSATYAGSSNRAIVRVDGSGVELKGVWPGWERLIAYFFLHGKTGLYDNERAEIVGRLASALHEMSADEGYDSVRAFEGLLYDYDLAPFHGDADNYEYSIGGIEYFSLLRMAAAEWTQNGGRAEIYFVPTSEMQNLYEHAAW